MSGELEHLVLKFEIDKLKSRLKTEYKYSGSHGQCVSYVRRQREANLIVCRNTDRAFAELNKKFKVKGLYV